MKCHLLIACGCVSYQSVITPLPHELQPVGGRSAAGGRPVNSRWVASEQPVGARSTAGGQPVDGRSTAGVQPVSSRWTAGQQPVDGRLGAWQPASSRPADCVGILQDCQSLRKSEKWTDIVKWRSQDFLSKQV